MTPAGPSSIPLAAALLASLCAPPAAAAQGDPPAGDPLAGFERLIGTWTAGTTTQAFEWGVGRRIVRVRASVSEGDAARLYSEGIFLHDPLRDEVRGYLVAVDMSAGYFEYSARWDDDALVASLTTIHPDGSRRRYLERWEFTGEDRFLWTLREGEDGAASLLASAEFRRVPPSAEEGEPDTADPRGSADPPGGGRP